MLQNREVEGATLGSGRRTRPVAFGPYGFVNMLVPTALLTLFLAVLASESSAIRSASTGPGRA